MNKHSYKQTQIFEGIIEIYLQYDQYTVKKSIFTDE